MTLRRNLLAGMTSSVWSALLGFAVVPLYLKYLGIEAYGLIGFFTTTQALLSLLDLGLAPTMNREVARCSASGNIKEAGALLHTLAVVYWAMAAFIALIILTVAPIIAQHWLQPKHIPQATVSHTVMLMGLVAAARWPIGLYQGALIGAHRMTISSGVTIAMTTLGSAGAVAILAFVSPTIQAFFIWQACIGLIYAATMRGAAWRIVGRPESVRFEFGKLKSIWSFSTAMSGLAVLGLVFTQLDKVILSKVLGLGEFAHYMLATLVANGLLVIISPVFNTIYPQFTSLVVADNTKKLISMYRMGTRMLATVLFPATILLAVFSSDLVRMWLANEDAALQVAPIISLLAIGTALHSIMYFPYALQLAYGMVRLPIAICIVLIILMAPLIIFFALQYGALGGAIAWLILNVLYVLSGTWLTHRYLLKGIGGKWLIRDVGIPLAISILVGMVEYYAVHKAAYPAYLRLLCGGILSLVASLLSLLISPQLRLAALQRLKLKTEDAQA